MRRAFCEGCIFDSSCYHWAGPRGCSGRKTHAEAAKEQEKRLASLRNSEDDGRLLSLVVVPLPAVCAS